MQLMGASARFQRHILAFQYQTKILALVVCIVHQLLPCYICVQIISKSLLTKLFAKLSGRIKTMGKTVVFSAD